MALKVKKTPSGTIYECSCCGQAWKDLPLCFGNDFPDYYYSIPPDERDKRVEKTESLCAIDEEHFFHRGQLVIPINDNQQDLIFNIWTTISVNNFIKRNELWENPDRVKEDPYFGRRHSIIPTYCDTINIKTIAIENEVGLIPTIKVIEEGHALKIDQENGISFEKALDMAGSILTSEHKNT